MIARWLRRASETAGFSMVEVMVAMSLLALGAAAWGTSAGNGLELVGTSKERQSAIQIATTAMETVRTVPYDALALPSATAFDGGGESPDSEVAGGSFRGETLVLSATADLEHRRIETVNGLDHDIYTFVTWVVDGTVPQAYKRVTIVVQWQGTSIDGEPKRLTLTTLISHDGVRWSTTPTTSTAPSSSTTTTTTALVSTPTTLAVTACVGDVTPPAGSISILAGTGANTGYTASSTVSLALSASDPCTPIQMGFANDGSGSYSASIDFSTSHAWSLSVGDGNKTVTVRFTDGAGNASAATGSIRVDATKPTTPGGFTGKAAANHRSVTVTWSAATDNDTLVGYRVYRRTGTSETWLNQSLGGDPCSASPCSWTDLNVSAGTSYSYYVVSYDAAGNESIATATRTFTP